MKQITLKIEEHVWKLIKQRAEEQGTKPARFLRSLIDKGLVVDKQGDNINLSLDSPIVKKLAEMMVENVSLSRQILWRQLSEEDSEEDKELATMTLKEVRLKAISLIEKLFEQSPN